MSLLAGRRWRNQLFVLLPTVHSRGGKESDQSSVFTPFSAGSMCKHILLLLLSPSIKVSVGWLKSLIKVSPPPNLVNLLFHQNSGFHHAPKRNISDLSVVHNPVLPLLETLMDGWKRRCGKCGACLLNCIDTIISRVGFFFFFLAWRIFLCAILMCVNERVQREK